MAADPAASAGVARTAPEGPVDPMRPFTILALAAARVPAARLALAAALGVATAGPLTPPLVAQSPFAGEVRQLVTFRFLPGRSAEALRIYEDEAIPLYRAGREMRSFRGLREVESPVPLDLVVVSSFDGMAGMDRSNEELRSLAGEAGTSIGAIYGAIGSLSATHHDEFVEMLPELGDGDPTSRRLVALVRYRTVPGARGRFERALTDLVEWEIDRGIAGATGRFLLSDGWTHLRLVGFESLATYQSYWNDIRADGDFDRLDEMIAERREVVLAPVPALAVR